VKYSIVPTFSFLSEHSGRRRESEGLNVLRIYFTGEKEVEERGKIQKQNHSNPTKKRK
jgi:hypothetical protein